MATNCAILIVAISLIGLIALTQALQGIRSVVITVTAIPLLLALWSIRKENRQGIFIGSLLSLLYFCGGILALFADGESSANDTPIAFMYTLAVTCWFFSSVFLIKALSTEDKSAEDKSAPEKPAETP